jgi:deazaflavin-dependent oxidoreductase (nitroreductase family)
MSAAESKIERIEQVGRQITGIRNPDWYRNLAAAGDGSVERGTETYQVTVRELAGAERDRIYAEQARRYPGFAEYERQTAGVRTTPVLELQRM